MGERNTRMRVAVRVMQQRRKSGHNGTAASDGTECRHGKPVNDTHATSVASRRSTARSRLVVPEAVAAAGSANSPGPFAGRGRDRLHACAVRCDDGSWTLR